MLAVCLLPPSSHSLSAQPSPHPSATPLLAETVKVMEEVRPHAHVDLDCFFAAAEELRHPEFVGQPLAVGGGPNRGVIATANYAARRFGVGSAMPVRLALQKCPDLVIVPPDFSWYKTLSLEVFATVADFVESFSPMSLDEARCTLLPSQDWSTLPDLAERLRESVRHRTGLAISFGAGPTPIIAKLAVGRAKPDGAFIVDPSAAEDFLTTTALADIPGLGPSTLARLTSSGIYSVVQLSNTPVLALESLIGRAHAASILSAVSPLPQALPSLSSPASHSIGSETTLPEDVRDFEQFRSLVKEVATTTTARLHHRGLGARGLTLKARSSSFADITRSRAFPAPTNDGYDITRVALSLAPEVFDTLGSSIRLVGVTVTGLTDLVQPSLPLGQSRLAPLLPPPFPDTGQRVQHRVFGNGVVMLGSPDTAIVKFDTGSKIIEDPRTHLVIIS